MAFLGSSQIKGSATRLNAAGDRFATSLGKGVRRKGVLSRVLGGIETLMALAIAFLLALFVLSIVSPLPTPKDIPAPIKVAAPTFSPDGGPINPFGKVAVIGGPVAEIDLGPELEETKLDLILHGTWMDENGGTAIIKTPDGKQGRFAVGEEIWNDVELDQVYRTQVTIVRAGVRESLRLINSRPSSAPPLRVTPEEVLNRDARSPVGQEGLGLIGDQVMVLAEDDGEGGKQFLIFPAEDEESFEELGFKAGDVLVGVGDVWVGTDAALAITSLAALIEQPSAEIKVERNGVVVPLSISLAGAFESEDDE